MRVVSHEGKWQIEGPGAERAVLAFAKAAGDHLEYEVDAQLRAVEARTASTRWVEAKECE